MTARRSCVDPNCGARASGCPASRSDCPGEFDERVLDPLVRARVNVEFVVAAADVLHQRVTAHDHLGGVAAFEAAHRAEPGLEPSVVTLDPVVRVLLRVMKRGRQETFDRSPQRGTSGPFTSIATTLPSREHG